MRNSKDIGDALGHKPIIDGFGRIPLLGGYVNITLATDDDIETKSCGYVKGSVNLRSGNTTYGDLVVYKDVMYLKDDLAEEYVEVMDLPDTEIPSMTFRDAYHYADLIFSQDFEGIDNDLNLTKE